MATIDIFNPVNVNITLNTPVNTPLQVNNVALVTSDIAVLPVVDRIKAYTTAAAVSTDYGSTSDEALFANLFFGQGTTTGTLILLSCDPGMTPATGFLADAIADGYAKAVSQNLGGFTGIAYAETNVSPLWGTPAEAVAELLLIQTLASDNNTTFFTLIWTQEADILSQTAGNPLLLIQAQQFLKYLYVGVLGYSTFASDPDGVNKRDDACVFGYLSGVSLTTIGQLFLYRQTFTGCYPLPVGQTDTNAIVYTPALVNTLVAGQLNLYVQNGPQEFFADALLAIDGKNISFASAYISIFLADEIQEQFDAYFSPGSLPYNTSGIVQGTGTLTTIMKSFAAAGAIDPLFTIIAPTIPNPIPPAPRILGPWQISGQIDGIAYAVSINGNLNV